MQTACEVLINLNVEGTEAEYQWHCSSPDSVTYTEMKEKVADIFPKHQGHILELMWLDSDGDLVTFSSDEELQQLFHEARKRPVQVTIRDCSVDVPCISCPDCGDGSADCENCSDYDMCLQCEGSDPTTYHPMEEQNSSDSSKMLEQFWQWMQSTPEAELGSEAPRSDEAREDRSRSGERKRRWKDMTEQCMRQMQELNIKRNVPDRSKYTDQEDNDRWDEEMCEDEEECGWEDLMQDWLREHWNKSDDEGEEDEISGEATWQLLMRKLYSYLTGATEQHCGTDSVTDMA